MNTKTHLKKQAGRGMDGQSDSEVGQWIFVSLLSAENGYGSQMKCVRRAVSGRGMKKLFMSSALDIQI